MTPHPNAPAWAARVKQDQIRSLYENDAQGILDEALLNEVGWGLYSRCKSFLVAVEALRGRAACPLCATIILHSSQPDELLNCPACGWEGAWKAYHQSFQHKQLSGAESVIDLFQEYVQRFPNVQDAPQKMLLIDSLIHGWHWNAIHRLGPQLNTRAAGVNLIVGSYHAVLEFLDDLSVGPGSTPGISKRQEEWRQLLKRSSDLWG